MSKDDFDPSPPNWFNSEISKLIPYPITSGKCIRNFTEYDNYIGLGDNKFNSKYVKSFKFNNPTNNIEGYEFNKLHKPDIMKEEIKLLTRLNNSINTLNMKRLDKSFITVTQEDVVNEKKINANTKSLITKINKKISNLDKTTICKQYQIFPTKQQSQIFNKWFDECKKVYDFCIKKYENNPSIFDKSYILLKKIQYTNHI